MRRSLILYFSILLLVPKICAGQNNGVPVTEYHLKAAFLYNFTKYVTWPNEVWSDSSKPIIIGVIGYDPFSDVLDRIIRDKKVGGKNLVVKRFKSFDELDFCHVLFISKLEKRHTTQILNKARKKNILTVSETPAFIHQGGIINFLTIEGKVRFEINVAAAEEVRLKMSSKLLRLAENLKGMKANGTP